MPRNSCCWAATRVQVCTYVMKSGLSVSSARCATNWRRSWTPHNFRTLADFKGHSLQYFTSHHDLVQRQATARKSARAPAASQADGRGIAADHEWRGDEFVRQTDALSRG